MGRSLTEALRLLQDRGWPVVFSSRLVRDSMRVAEEPGGSDRRALLADLVRPHGLAVRDGARGRFVVVAAPRSRETQHAPESRAVEPQSTAPAAPAASMSEEIVVTPDRDLRAGASVVPFILEANDGSAPPRLGEDALSAIGVVPGVVSTEGSARLNVRGGGQGEAVVLLDGFELVTPYHLGDFDDAVSVVTPSSVERADLFTGAYPAEYGNATSGVVDLTTRMPTQERHFALGLDMLHAEGSGSGALGQRSRWFGATRSGSHQWPLELSGRDEHPRYWDAFGKVDLEVGSRQTLAAQLLVAVDQYELSSEHSEDDAYHSDWDSRYAWLRHTAVLGRNVYAETLVGRGRVGRDRVGSLGLSGSSISASERRHLDFYDLRQDWHSKISSNTALKWGFDLERSDTTLDFRSDRELTGGLLPALDEESLALEGPFDRRFGSTHVAAYGSTQLHPVRGLSLELGLRHDTVTLSDERHLSPRLAAAWELGPRSVVRAAWGWFYQSQRPYQLQLEESGATQLAPAVSERAEQDVLGFEHRFEDGMTLLVEAYRRRVVGPRVRFENLFDPVLLFPELGEDRVRVAPESGTAAGLELTLRSPPSRRWGWWTTYVRSSAVDEIDQRWIPRSIDQPHSFRAGLRYGAPRGFDVDLLWQYHTGWPTTAVEAKQIEASDGTIEWVPLLGPRNGERLPDYHRLDLRVGRSWSLGLGRISAHVDVLDVYDRRNLRGFEDLRLVPDSQGGVTVSRRPVTWAGFVPSVGVRWEF